MLTFDINELALEEMRAEDGSLAYKLDFPVYAAKGSRDTSVVYFEIETGLRSACTRTAQRRWSSSSKELVRASSAGKQLICHKVARSSSRAMVPHHITNTGDGWRVSLARAWGRRRRYPSR